ncbi:glycosyltransferase family 2 protein [Denitrobacterium detoxificans]|uniref:glycosyltransferase family 2 protein n=1 Tax=Denitrobacterium detoxificans TaxID=79604 RepID=UPI0026ECEBA5|nr:glycosyltransferase family 2 protein [Denitrobacterium detoxificans]MBE6465819.1 glycosyltransferase family 2 protein [Denitrobacterium detoxificans]
MNPTLTIAMPCYNTAEYLDQCFDSLLDKVSGIEIVAIDDGSTDETLSILEGYQQRYPESVRVFHQENAGWGGAINHALREAQGTFMLVLDSDDHLDAEALERVVRKIEELEAENAQVDLFVTNFVYDHVADKSTKQISYRNMMPRDRVFTWADTKNPSISEYFMMHAMTYRVQTLRESDLKLPEHAAYMDSIYALHPLPHVRNLYYMDVDLYFYLIGREGQSIEIEVLKKHISEQLQATRHVIDDFNYEELRAKSPQMADSIARYLSTMMTVSTIYLFKINTAASIAEVRSIWKYLEENDSAMYRFVKHSMAGWTYRHTPIGRALARGVYSFVNRIFKFA